MEGHYGRGKFFRLKNNPVLIGPFILYEIVEEKYVHGDFQMKKQLLKNNITLLKAFFELKKINSIKF